MGSNILSLNNETIFTGKYEVEDRYNLVIKNVQFHDEGIYECDTGEQRLTVALQVAGELIQLIIIYDNYYKYPYVIKLQISDQGAHNRHKIF